jgi:class 3 adenylate cyclase
MTPRDPPKRRFVRRLVAAAVVLAIVPVIAVGLLLIDINRDALRERGEEVLFAVTDDVVHEVGTALDDARAQLAGISGLLADSTISTELRIAAARAMVAARGQGAVALYDDTGAKIDTIVADGMSWRGNDSLIPELRERATQDGFALGPVEVIDEVSRVPLVVPIKGEATRWFAVTLVSLEPLAERLLSLARDRFAGRFDGIAVIDAGMRFIIHVDPERRLTPAGQLDALRGIDAPALRAGILVYREVDGAGGGVLAVVRSVPGLPWAVVAQLPREQVYAPLEHARRLVIIAVASAALLALIAALLLSRRAAAPIQKLVELARDLGRRKFERRVELRTGDELETLAIAMSNAAAELDASEQRLREEAAIRTQLRRYLPGKLVERIVAHEPATTLASGRRRITVVFADIAAFSALAEREPPDRVAALLNQLFTMLTEIVFRHGGTVDKLIGDCIMAFWGAPDDQPDHAQRAVAAAIDMQRWLDVANDCWEQSLGLTIHLAIGVHTGDAVVGNLGSDARMEYTCVGDTVNVASRLEGLARPQQILISEATRECLDPAVRCAHIGRRRLPGRMAPVELHEILL